MSKAQKILGIAEINIDAPRQWDTASTTSGISVCVSESTATFNTSERSRGPRHDDGGGGGGGGGGNSRRNTTQWEQESEIVPAYLANRFSQLNTADYREFTETSSLTRRGSNSTITSWYDKSKMPLSISQQTSSSAMAKGLPQKANAVLDIEGKESNHMVSSGPKLTKRPSRLDLAPLFSLHKHHSFRSKNESQRDGDESKMPPPAPIPPRAERKLVRRSTLDSLKSMTGRPRTGSSSRRGANDISTLPNLYENYEQMSFDRVLGHDDPLAASDPSLDKARQIPDQKRNAPRPPIRHEGASSAYQIHRSVSPEPPKPTGQADRDCASSVSSRYTKTSRASKRTSQSINESDLAEKSVLSLSSDSEDDAFTDSVSKFTGGSRSSDAGSLDPSSSVRSAHSRDASSVGHSSRRSTKHASFSQPGEYLAIPSKPPLGQPPVVYPPRMSSLPATTYRPPAASGRLSRNSANSSTTNSTGDRPMRPAYGVHETRASSVPPPTEFHRQPVRVEQPQRVLSTKSTPTRSVDQPTPPMSPTSAKASIASEPPADSPRTTDARFMAVTRQEEMLLAALRMKRARMRETILAEYDEEVRSASPHRHQRNSSQTTITEINWPEPPQTLRHQTSANSASTIRAGSRSSGSRPESTAPDKSHQRSSSRHAEPGPRSSSRMLSRATGARKMVPVQEATPVEAKRERVPLYLDRPVGHVGSMDLSEPTPDLSDYMDFDNGSETEDEPLGDASFFRGRDARQGAPSKDRGRMLRTGERNGHEPFPSRPRGEHAPVKERGRAVAGVDGDVVRFGGVPRPDSPVSPEDALGFTTRGLAKRKAVRLSAVGNSGVEAASWGHDG
ncbi:uncharacterized protein GLRG_06567 [Colletotrichum graminicola M1.001]|uniref:Uncharacterized protein n=1 Tax=Colletotrichum graminicola (strain M1.001 / M2 / FGSC 10212) TaxID=645133 RepID=E3QKN5_COLGM|nr:uncharacterized protein GLRG_06567 [Colletotrichum graminicola M1.001]EFQ31423.1 hypothetical protein GLRG_06567 [Colletotrichum graminicola M1.001]